jgi:hypothetical protein
MTFFDIDGRASLTENVSQVVMDESRTLGATP